MMSEEIYYPIMWLVIVGLAVGLLIANNNIAYCKRYLGLNPDLPDEHGRVGRYLSLAPRVILSFIAILVIGGILSMYHDFNLAQQQMLAQRAHFWPIFDAKKVWTAPDPYLAETEREAALIAYGRNLIARTQDYFGQQGLVRPSSINGMNCQNCHLDAGSKPFGNNYFAVVSTYPQMRARSGSLESIPKRINDCFQRSLNGQPLDTAGHEMQAMIAYMRWLGTGVPKDSKPKGTGLVDVPMLQRAADPQRGQLVYNQQCASCHGTDGAGLPMPEGAREYPPLWGNNSYNEGAGLFRLSRLAGYVKANMPFGATYDHPQLSDEEAWDVAAYINSQPRPPHPFLDTDWPKIEKKPFDHPFGPYSDTFSIHQHKYGPFEPIIAYYKSQQKK